MTRIITATRTEISVDPVILDLLPVQGSVELQHDAAGKIHHFHTHPVDEILRLFSESKRAAGLPAPDALDMNPVGLETNRRNLEVAIDCVYRQGMIPRRFQVEELFA